MKMTKIALALATLVAAPSAFALTPAQVDGTTARLWLSGASAPTASVYKGALTLCAGMKYKDALGVEHTNPGTRDAHLYLESADAGKLPGGAGERMAYTCTVDTDDDRAGTLENTKVVVFHTVEGGSFNYVTPHISIAGEVNPNLPGNLGRTPNIEGLGVTGKCAAGAAESVSIDLSGLSNTVGVYRNCGFTTVNFTAGQALRADVYQAPDRPEGGFSDTEYLINKLNLDVTTELGDIGSEVPTNIGQAFGVGVSYPLYAQLQKNDGIIATTAADGEACDGVYAAGPCQPNLPSQRYTSIASSSSIGGVDATTFGAASATPPGTSGKIQLHRRAITSGTQSASNLRFLNKPCATGTPQGALDPARDVLHDTATVNVTENSSTGGVKKGLTKATAAGEFGLGVVSMENVPNGNATDGQFAFVKLNGVSPNSDTKQRANAMDGTYDMWYELVAFTSYNAFPEGVDLINAVNGSIGNPGITDLTGLFITPASGYTGASVGKGARTGNSCQPAVQ